MLKEKADASKGATVIWMARHSRYSVCQETKNCCYPQVIKAISANFKSLPGDRILLSQDEIKIKIIHHIHISPEEILEEILLGKKTSDSRWNVRNAGGNKSNGIIGNMGRSK